ncbi:MAG: protein TolA [Gammaproteobacteria bacterium]|nr:MAG: protein TolA [Gammaproteobacteria bacterium]
MVVERNGQGNRHFDRSYIIPAVMSALLHLVVLAAVMFGWDFFSEVRPTSAPRYINAVLVDEGALKAIEAKKQKQEGDIKKEKLENQRKKELREKARFQKKQAEAQKKKKEQKKKIEQKRKAEQAKKQAEAIKKKQERERQLALKKKKAELKKKEEIRKKERLRKQQKQKELEKKKQREQQIKQKKEQEEKAKREKERLLKEKRRRREEQANKLLQESLKAERDRLEREAAEKRRIERERAYQLALEAQRVADSNEIDRYMSLIQKRIRDKWHEPVSARSGMKVELRIKLLPTGELLSAEVIRSSGNLAFDNSAVSAARGIVKYPVPNDKRLFNKYFRQLTLLFNPKD